MESGTYGTEPYTNPIGSVFPPGRYFVGKKHDAILNISRDPEWEWRPELFTATGFHLKVPIAETLERVAAVPLDDRTSRMLCDEVIAAGGSGAALLEALMRGGARGMRADSGPTVVTSPRPLTVPEHDKRDDVPPSAKGDIDSSVASSNTPSRLRSFIDFHPGLSLIGLIAGAMFVAIQATNALDLPASVGMVIWFAIIAAGFFVADNL